MKGVVLAGGKGTRLRPITHSIAKQLVPVANQPILFYGLHDLAAAGVEDVAIIVSPETGSEMEAAVGDGSRFGIRPHFIVQAQPDGLAAALGLSLPWVGDDACIMYLGDNLVKDGVTGVVGDFERRRPNCQILLAKVEHPEHYGVAELADDGSIRRLVEKPKNPPSDLALVGVYMFDPSIGEAVSSITPSARGELEITDAIQYLIEHGKDVRASRVDGWWKDTGHKEDLLDANELVLHNLEGHLKGEVINTELSGVVSIGHGSRIVDSRVTGPVIIGENTLIERSTIGPYTAVGDHCYLSDCASERSIIMDRAEVHDWQVRSGLLGRHSILQGPAPQGHVAVTLGEHSEVGTR